MFALILGALLIFWTVKNTKPSGSAVFPILYGALIASALIWVLTALLRRRSTRKPDASESPTSHGPRSAGIHASGSGYIGKNYISGFDEAIHAEGDWKVERNVGLGPSPFPRTKLESAVVRSLVAAKDIERERAVQGNRDFFDRLLDWAGDTDKRLSDANAGALHDRFRQDGLQPPHGINEQVAYIERQITLFEDALRQLRSDEPS